MSPQMKPSQRFREIKAHHLASGTFFEDVEFAASYESVDPTKFKYPKCESIKWMRPREIHTDPQLFNDDGTPLDVCQGQLGDCWLLAAMGSLTLDKHHLHMVVPTDQSFEKGEYTGAFRFNFWRFGKWMEVIIDDRLPTENGKLMFAHSPGKGEMWPALLEKAYAKLFKSYVSIWSGMTSEALVDFTGGLTEVVMLHGDSIPEQLFKHIQKAHWKNYLMCSSVSSSGTNEEQLDNGLVTSHSYSITETAVVKIRNKAVELIRVRNPWGNGKEWNGAWSDDSKEWTMLSEKDKNAMQVKSAGDGEFWMSFEDYKKAFTKLTICYKASYDGDSKTQFKVHEYSGAWVKNVTAGGCANYPDTFANNPQFGVHLKHANDDEDNQCTMIVCLMQKNARVNQSSLLNVGCTVYPVSGHAHKFRDSEGRFTRDFFAKTQFCGERKPYTNMRGVTNTLTLPPGEYCIVPSTFKPNQEGEFYLRILTEKEGNSSRELGSQVKLSRRGIDSYGNYATEKRQDIEAIKTNFDTLAGNDNVVYARELLKLIDKVSKKIDESKPQMKHSYALLSLFDKNSSSKIEFLEFMKMYRFLTACVEVFKKNSNSGKCSPLQLERAFQALDIHVPRKIIATAVARYGDKTSNISFCDFLSLVCRIRSVIEKSGSLNDGSIERLLVLTITV